MDVKSYWDHPGQPNHSPNNKEKDSFMMGWAILRHLLPRNVMECSIRIKGVTKRCTFTAFMYVPA